MWSNKFNDLQSINIFKQSYLSLKTIKVHVETILNKIYPVTWIVLPITRIFEGALYHQTFAWSVGHCNIVGKMLDKFDGLSTFLEALHWGTQPTLEMIVSQGLMQLC